MADQTSTSSLPAASSLKRYKDCGFRNGSPGCFRHRSHLVESLTESGLGELDGEPAGSRLGLCFKVSGNVDTPEFGNRFVTHARCLVVHPNVDRV